MKFGSESMNLLLDKSQHCQYKCNYSTLIIRITKYPCLRKTCTCLHNKKQVIIYNCMLFVVEKVDLVAQLHEVQLWTPFQFQTRSDTRIWNVTHNSFKLTKVVKFGRGPVNLLLDMSLDCQHKSNHSILISRMMTYTCLKQTCNFLHNKSKILIYTCM